MEKPTIFITNDDGVGAKGLDHLIEIARKIGRVLVIASERGQSGKSHSITMHKPLYLHKLREEEDLQVYSCSGTPVDCVKMAFDHMLKGKMPDISLSGINHGSNSAISILYSGTMGAAIEASFYHVPSIGFSLLDSDADADFEASSEYVEKIIRMVLEKAEDLPMCLNVNIPAVKRGELKGIRVCRQNKGYWEESFYCRVDPRGREYFWLTGSFKNHEPEAADTDEWALNNDYISVVPIQIDMTDYEQVESVSKWKF